MVPAYPCFLYLIVFLGLAASPNRSFRAAFVCSQSHKGDSLQAMGCRVLTVQGVQLLWTPMLDGGGDSLMLSIGSVCVHWQPKRQASVCLEGWVSASATVAPGRYCQHGGNCATMVCVCCALPTNLPTTMLAYRVTCYSVVVLADVCVVVLAAACNATATVLVLHIQGGSPLCQLQLLHRCKFLLPT